MEHKEKLFGRIARAITKFTGSASAFICACLLILVWLAAGPFFHWSDTHSLVVNTATTCITFLQIFLLQHSQNKDTLAIHIKLDEIIKALEKADDNFRSIEDKTEEEIKKLKESME